MNGLLRSLDSSVQVQTGCCDQEGWRVTHGAAAAVPRARPSSLASSPACGDPAQARRQPLQVTQEGEEGLCVDTGGSTLSSHTGPLCPRTVPGTGLEQHSPLLDRGLVLQPQPVTHCTFVMGSTHTHFPPSSQSFCDSGRPQIKDSTKIL